MAQTIPIPITVSLVVPKLSLCIPIQSAWWYLDYPYTHHSLPGDTQTILVFITAALVVLGLSFYSSQSLWWSSVYPYHITFCFVVLRVSLYRVSSHSKYWLRQSLYSSQCTWWLRQSLYSSQSPSWYQDYPFTHHSLPGGTRTIPILIIVSLVVLRLSLYPSQSPW